MSVSRFRPINWNKEDRILRDDMPHEFRRLLEGLKSHRSSRAETYALALEGLGAMTYAVAIGAAAAQLGDKRSRLLEAIQAPAHQNAVRALNKQEHYVQICLETLPELLRAVDVDDQLDGILNDICLSPGLSSAELVERFREFREAGNGLGRRDISQLNNKLYDLVSSIFGYWPKYALGFFDRKRRCICFDTDELGPLPFQNALESNRFRFSLRDLPADFPPLNRRKESVKSHSSDGSGGIDIGKLRTVFLADSDLKKIWMISPFVLVHLKSVNDRNSYEYLFLDPTWSNSNNALTWRRFNSALSWAEGTSEGKRGTALAAQIKANGNAELIDRLLTYPCEVQLNSSQENDTFHFLENELRKVEFKLDNGEIYRLADRNDDRGRIFYKTGPSLFVEVKRSDDRRIGSNIAIAKVLQNPDRGIYGFEEQRFRAEVSFLKTYFSDWERAKFQSPGAPDSTEAEDNRRIGAGITHFRGHGVTQSADNLGSAFLNRPFTLHEGRDRNLRDFIEEVSQERRPKDPQLAAIWSARRLMRALYMIERAAATLALIYKKTQSTISGKKLHFIHRDIRPEILLYLGYGIVKICDFSAAFFPKAGNEVIFLEDEDTDGMQDNVILDSYGMSSHYCAPEVYDQPNVYSNTADVFSLGIVLNELLFGHEKNQQLGRKKNVQRTITAWRLEKGKDKDWGSLLFDSPNDDDKRICGEIESFAAGEAVRQDFVADKTGRYFNLATLVGSATCHWRERLSMEQFRDRVAAAGHVLRHYLANRCRKIIAQGLESRNSDGLEYALKCASSVFGQHPDVRKPLAMVRCAACQQCDRYEYDVDIKNYRCHAAGMRSAISRLEAVARIASGAASEVDGSRIEINYQDARRALKAIDEALEICPGIIDRVPEELHITLNAEKLAPHARFHEIGLSLFKPSGFDELSVQEGEDNAVLRSTSPDEDIRFEHSRSGANSILAAELLKLIGIAATRRTSNVQK